MGAWGCAGQESFCGGRHIVSFVDAISFLATRACVCNYSLFFAIFTFLTAVFWVEGASLPVTDTGVGGEEERRVCGEVVLGMGIKVTLCSVLGEAEKKNKTKQNTVVLGEAWRGELVGS